MDVLDGAVHYVQGLPQWCVSLTLVRNHVPVETVAQPRFWRDLHGRSRAWRGPQRRTDPAVSQTRPLHRLAHRQPPTLHRPARRIRPSTDRSPRNRRSYPQPRPHLMANRRHGRRPRRRLLAVRYRRHQPPRRRPDRPRSRCHRHRHLRRPMETRLAKLPRRRPRPARRASQGSPLATEQGNRAREQRSLRARPPGPGARRRGLCAVWRRGCG